MKKLLFILLSIVSLKAISQTANAGNDSLSYHNQTRQDTIVLDGSKSTGTITAWLWTFVSGPTGITPTIISSTSQKTYAVGNFTAEGTYTFQLKINNNNSLTDQMSCFVRDWQKKNDLGCRPGYNTTTKVGGKAFIVPPSFTQVIDADTTIRKYVWPYMNRDQVVGENVMGGDTLWYQGTKKCTGFELGDIGGGKLCPVYVYFKDEPVVLVHSQLYIGMKDSNVVQHVVIDGTKLRNTYAYGLQIDNKSYPIGNAGYNMAIGWFSDLTIKGFYKYNTGSCLIKLVAGGPSWKTNPMGGGMYDKFISKVLVIDDWVSKYNDGEMLYIGSTDPEGTAQQEGNKYGAPPRIDSVTVTNVLAQYTGRDGIQIGCSPKYNIIKYCFVANTGRENVGSQWAGAFLGGKTRGRIDSTIVINSKGDGFEYFGGDTAWFQGNVAHNNFSGTTNSPTTRGSTGIYQTWIKQGPEVDAGLLTYNIGNVLNLTEKTFKIHVTSTNNNQVRPGFDQDNILFNPIGGTINQYISAVVGTTQSGNLIKAQDFSFSLDTIIITNGASTPWTATISQGGASYTGNGPSWKPFVEWLHTRARLSSINQAPSASAGSDQDITLPTTTASLSGSGTDVDGTIVSYSWTKLSGGSAVITTPATASTTVTGLALGTYVFRLTVTDNGGASSSADVKVNVLPASTVPGTIKQQGPVKKF